MQSRPAVISEFTASRFPADTAAADCEWPGTVPSAVPGRRGLVHIPTRVGVGPSGRQARGHIRGGRRGVSGTRGSRGPHPFVGSHNSSEQSR